MDIIAIINQKGGVAKTTTTHAIGAGLGAMGAKVLLVDIDPQASLSSVVGANMAGYSTLDLLLRKCQVAQAIQKGPRFDIIPASEGLAAEGILTQTGKEYRLREALQPLKAAYDFILIDCPPSLGILTINALTAANSCIIPAQADMFSLQAIQQLQPTIETIRTYTNRDLFVRGIVITRYNGRAVLSREAVEMIQAQAENMNTKLYGSKIRECISIKEAQAVRQDIFAYAPKSNAAIDYGNLVNEIMREER